MYLLPSIKELLRKSIKHNNSIHIHAVPWYSSTKGKGYRYERLVIVKNSSKLCKDKDKCLHVSL